MSASTVSSLTIAVTRFIRSIISALNESFPQGAPFGYTSIQVNWDTISEPHVDKGNSGPSIILVLGDFSSGGEVVVEKPAMCLTLPRPVSREFAPQCAP